MPRWYSSSYQDIYDALMKLVPRFPPNLHLLPIYATDFTMFEQGSFSIFCPFFDQFVFLYGLVILLFRLVVLCLFCFCI